MFEDKVILITGTSKGIGRALVEYFLTQKAFVIAVSRKKMDIAESGHFINIVSDIRDVHNIITVLNDKEIIPDVLINNAGVNCYRSLMEVSIEEIHEVFDINLIYTFELSRQIVKKCVEKGRNCNIVNTISFAAAIPSVGSAIYAASKSALESLTKTMAAEWAPYGIRVNGYSPGVIITDMTRPAIERDGDNMKKAIALHGFGSVDDVVNAVAFLASDKSSYITGINLDVSGGKYIVQNSDKAWN